MKQLFEGQIWHYTILLFLLLALNEITNHFPDCLSGQLWGISASFYFLLAVIIPIVHQIYVWLFWRLELHFNSLTSLLGEKAFLLFKIDFLILFISRPASVLLLSLANKNSLNISLFSTIALSALLLTPVIYLAHSLLIHFGLDRALGKDHFDKNWAKEQGIIRKGIFRFNPNSMYFFGFLFLYAIAILFKSQGGLIVAMFNHIYIWCHYYFTERKDMASIYHEDESVK
jgi:hypothetical protein